MIHHQIHTPSNMSPPPYSHEMFVAQAISVYFDIDVTFIRSSNTVKSADLIVGNTIWEIKSPIGSSKRTIQNNLRKADNQSFNIIISLFRCKMESDKAINRIRYELKKANKVKRLLVVKKDGRILVLK